MSKDDERIALPFTERNENINRVNFISNVISYIGVLQRIRSFTDVACLAEVSKAFRHAEITGVQQAIYFVNHMNVYGMSETIGISPRLFNSFRDLVRNSDNLRICKLESKSSTFYLDKLWQRYEGLTDLVIRNIFRENLSLKNHSNFVNNLRLTTLRSIWISYSEDDFQSVVAFRMADDEKMSFFFLYWLTRFLQRMEYDFFTALAENPEFKRMHYFCLSEKELESLSISNHHEMDLLLLLVDCDVLRGLNLLRATLDTQDFFSRWPCLVELRIFNLHVHSGVVFDVSELRSLKLLHIGVATASTIEIRNRSLKELLVSPLKVTASMHFGFDLLVINKKCISLKKLYCKVEIPEIGSLVPVELPVGSLSLEEIYLENCLIRSDLDKRLLCYQNLKKLCLMHVEGVVHVFITANLMHLVELWIQLDRVDTIYLPKEMKYLEKLVIGGIDLNCVRFPKVAPKLYFLGLNRIEVLSSKDFLSIPYPRLGLLHIEECILDNFFIFPSHYPLLRFLTFERCTMKHVFLPPAWRPNVRIEFIDWVGLKDIYDFSEGRFYQLYASKNGRIYDVQALDAQDSPEIAKLGAIFQPSCKKRWRKKSRYSLRQTAYFNPKAEEIHPTRLKKKTNSHRQIRVQGQPSECTIL